MSEESHTASEGCPTSPGSDDIIRTFEQLPDNEKAMVVSSILYEERYQGPLPAPRDLEQYERILPGAAERILRMAEKQQDYRIGMEIRSLKTASRQVARGHWMAFILSIILIGVAVALIFAGHPTLGGVIFSTTVVGLAAVFITQSVRNK